MTQEKATTKDKKNKNSQSAGLQGDGALAQGDRAIAVGTDGKYVGRDSNQYNLFVLKAGAFAPPPNLLQLRNNYLAHIEHNYRALDLKGIPQLRNLTSELSLVDVYVPLLARPERPEGETSERRVAGRRFGKESLPLETTEHNILVRHLSINK